MRMIINYDKNSKMTRPFPTLRKLGAVSPYGECTPFVYRGRLYRLELADPTRGPLDPSIHHCALIRDHETGEILTMVGEDIYYHSLYTENDEVYVLGVLIDDSSIDSTSGNTIVMYATHDLKNWERRVLFSNPGWRYFNTSLTKGPDGYVLMMEASEPAEYVGTYFTCFFATSPDLVQWTMMDYDCCFDRDLYNGGPWLRYSNGYYYLISVMILPYGRFSNYIFRTRDFRTWEVGDYNPILMPDNEDKKIAPHAFDLTPERLEEIRSGYNINNSDIDMCDWQGKTIITYIVGNQLGFYYMAEAEYDGTVDELLAAYFEKP